MNASGPIKAQPLPDGVIDENRVTQYTHGFVEEEEMSEIDKFNMGILKSTEWGLNPTNKGGMRIGHRPTNRPSIETIIKTHGIKTRMPRERPFVEKIGPRRMHNPPPKFGRTMRNLSADEIY
jgi:hypothetical protein